jgi:hypothetical protein
LKANAATINCKLGGGKHGYTGIVVDPIVYASMSTTPFAHPTCPTPPGEPLQTATKHQIDEARRQYEEATLQWETYINVCTALKNQIIQAIDEIYIESMKDPHTGFARVTIVELLEFLFTEYGDIDYKTLRENDRKMEQPWNVDLPFQTIIKQVNDAIAVASAGGDPLSAKRILRTAYLLVYDTGLYYEELEKWDEEQDADKTWDNFQKHMRAAQTKLKKRKTLNKHSGFHGANLAEEDLINLVTGAAQAPYADIQNIIKELQEEMKQLKSAKTETKQEQEATKTTKPSTRTRKTPKDHGGYCWSHGYAVAPGHTGKTCTKRAPGHQEEATRENTMGGSTKFKEALGL